MLLRNIAYFFIITISVVTILIYGQGLIIPFILGLLLWFIMRKLKASLNKVSLIRTYFPSWFKTILASALLLFAIVLVSNILTSNINALASSYEAYQANIEAVIQEINRVFKVDLVEWLQANSGDLDFGTLLGSIFNSLSSLLSNSFMIILYSLFVVFEEANFRSKLELSFKDKKQYDRLSVTLTKIEQSISSYLKLKTLVSLITGGLSYLVLFFIGIDSPFFWAFLIFLMNFIPTIGSLVGTVFPAVFCLLQFGEVLPSLLVLGIVGIIQVVVGNILEPRLMGSSMNISALVTILALSFWGLIWGVTGMILSVPITVIMLIICAQFERTRPIAILLSEKGAIET